MGSKLVRYLFTNCMIGVAIGWIIAALVIWLDVASIGTVISQTSEGTLAAGMLLFIMGTTFGMVQMGVAVMALSETAGSVWPFVHRIFKKMAIGTPGREI